MIHVISLGAGVQSSTMALMAAHGDIEPMPDAAVFADTGWEPRAVYEWLDWLAGENVLPFPIIRLEGKSLRDDIMRAADGHRWTSIPVFTGNGGMIQRHCTADYKIRPIRSKVRELAGIKGKRSPDHVVVTNWVGISTDEASRMKPQKEAWWGTRYPLIEAGMNRGDCLAWMARHEYPEPAKSACIGCPYHSDQQWRALTFEEFEDACEVDEALRNGGVRKMREKLYMHATLVPLREADLNRGQLDAFGNDCGGYCGV